MPEPDKNQLFKLRPVQLGQWTLIPNRNVLIREGLEKQVEPKVMTLILAFAQHAGEVLSRDWLIEQVWDGQIVSDSSMNWAIAQMRKALEDKANDPTYLETVPKRGYRLLIHPQVINATEAQSGEIPSPTKPVTRPYIRWFLIVVFGLVGWVVWYWGKAPEPQPALRYSFAGPTELVDYRLFSEGVDQALKERLQRMGPLAEPNASSAYSLTTHLTIQEDVLFLDSTLSYSEGTLIWRQSFQQPKECALDLVEELCQQVATSIHSKSSSPGPSYSAYELYFQGRAAFNRRNPKDLHSALDYFQRCLAVDPNFALAYTGISDTYGLLTVWGNLAPQEVLIQRQTAVEKALQLQPELAEAYTSLGAVLFSKNDFEAAISAYRKALELNNRQAITHHWLGDAYRQVGDLKGARTCFETAMSLDPQSPILKLDYGVALLQSGQIELGLEMMGQTIKLAPNFAGGWRTLGEAQLGQGRPDLAMESLKKARELDPENNLARRLQLICSIIQKDIALEQEILAGAKASQLEDLQMQAAFCHGDWLKLLSLCQSQRNTNPNHRLWYANALYGLRQYEPAESAYRDYFHLDSEPLIAVLQYTFLLRQSGNVEYEHWLSKAETRLQGFVPVTMDDRYVFILLCGLQGDWYQAKSVLGGLKNTEYFQALADPILDPLWRAENKAQ